MTGFGQGCDRNIGNVSCVDERLADGTSGEDVVFLNSPGPSERLEIDLERSLCAFGLDQPDDALRLRAETVIRNYDPCISCATHFLKIDVERR